jgi:HD-like signal output (HDOD) protein
MQHLEQALDSIEAYVAYFCSQPMPVLKRTVGLFEEMAQERDKISAKHLAGVVLADPLMTLRLLSHLQAHRHAHQNRDITTIDRAITMLGIDPFFETFCHLNTVEDSLSQYPKALVGVLRVIARAKRASHYARDWAVVRHDLDVDEITIATLLREAAEIMCWVCAPKLTQEAFDLLHNKPGLRSVIAQRAVFGIPFEAMQLQLVRVWQLPELLVTLMDPEHADNPRVRTVLLADDLSRHVSHGWGDPAIPDDLEAIEALLRIPRLQLLNRIKVPPEEQARFLDPEELGGIIRPASPLQTPDEQMLKP